MKPVLIGESPGKGYSGPPLDGRPGKRLCEMAGWPTKRPGETLRQVFDVVNVLDFYPGKDGKGSAWPKEKARAEGSRLLTRMGSRPGLIILGWRAADALGAKCASYGIWQGRVELGSPYVILPHPSGVNRTLNDAHVREMVGIVLRQAAQIGDR